MMVVNSITAITKKTVKKNKLNILNALFTLGLEGINIKVNTKKQMVLIIRYVLRSSCPKKANKVFTRHDVTTRKNIYLLNILTTIPLE